MIMVGARRCEIKTRLRTLFGLQQQFFAVCNTQSPRFYCNRVACLLDSMRLKILRKQAF